MKDQNTKALQRPVHSEEQSAENTLSPTGNGALTPGP